MKRRQTYHLSYMPVVGQAQRGQLPDYDKGLHRVINLDSGKLTPGMGFVQSKNCKTIERLQSVWAVLRRQQKSTLSV